MRSVQDRFWSDGWVRKLNPLDRYLFLYLLTNERTNWCGLYELEIGMMAFETGLDSRELETSMLPRISPKIVYVDGWVYVKNWTRHHMSESGNLSPQQKKGIEDAFSKVPERIRLKIKEIDEEGIPYAYPIGGVSASASSLSSASSNKTDSLRSPDLPLERKEVPEDSETPAKQKADPNVDKTLLHWRKKCRESVGQEPTSGIPAMKSVIKRAHQFLTWPQIKNKIDDWFDAETLEDHEMIQITRCFSTFQIDKFKAENV